MKLRWYFFAALVLFLSLQNSIAQTDTLVVRGKIENLTARLYRQAPEVLVARVNILQPTREIIRAAPLQPNGSFELKMPLIFPNEECYLTYNNVVMPFLGSEGAIEVIIYADSLTKSDIPLRFAGVNAEVNNLHAQFYTQRKKWLLSNPTETIKTTGAEQYWQQLNTESDRQIAYFRSLPAFTASPDLLEKWVVSSIVNTAKAQFYSFLLKTEQHIPSWVFATSPSTQEKSLLTTANLDQSNLLTFAKADFFQQFGTHAQLSTPPLAETSLPITKVASMILAYIPDIAPEDKTKLQQMEAGGSAKTRDLTMLNTLFNKKRDTLEIINAFELEHRKFGFYYGASGVDYLDATFYTRHLYNSSFLNKTIWYQYIRPKLSSTYYQKSLDELHHTQCIDTTALRDAHSMVDVQTQGDYVIELDKGITLYQKVYMEGREFWEDIKRKAKGAPTYLIFWTNDEYGIRALAEARQLEASLPSGRLNFVYVSEHKDDSKVWIENVIRSNCRGLHAKLTRDQNLFLEGEWGITQVPFTVLIDANGKYIKRDAPLPGDREGWNKIWPRVFK